jgi:hypothetical protein
VQRCHRLSLVKSGPADEPRRRLAGERDFVDPRRDHAERNADGGEKFPAAG